MYLFKKIDNMEMHPSLKIDFNLSYVNPTRNLVRELFKHCDEERIKEV